MCDLLSELLWRAAEVRPQHTAVEDGRGSLTYTELADRAARLAADLRAGGIKPGDRVGVMMPKSTHAVASLYGIMAAGGAYVPLDVGAPAGRLAYMVRNCGMKALVASASQAARLSGQLEDAKLQRIVLADTQTAPPKLTEKFSIPVTAWADVAANSPLDTPINVSTNDLAYILYTSGSTGEPKGVMISHANALAYVKWSHQTVEVGPDDRLSSHAPFHFDLSIFDLYVACLAKATLALVPSSVGLFPANLAAWIQEQRISVWYSVPSILIQMMDKGNIERFDYPQMRRMIFAGEVFATKYLRAWMEKLPDARWFNFYGPTETNVCTYYEVPAPPQTDEPISIGCASSGDTIYLCDEDHNVITEPGIEGEIWVDGPTVAKGYWADQDKTDSRFVVAGDLTGCDRRVYRTGDLACWDADGNLTFKGRRDHMIKSRGYRIELGEIEAAIYAHQDVNEACVVAVPDDQIGNRIRACVVRHEETSLDEASLGRHLGEKLPRYMLPEETVFMEALPKISTGKIDRVGLATKDLDVA